MTTVVRLGVASDIHLAPDCSPSSGWHNTFDFVGVAERLERAIRRMNEEDVDGVVCLGDITHTGDPESVDAVFRILARARSPVWIARGNHDVDLQTGALHAMLAPGVLLTGIDLEGPDADGGFRTRPGAIERTWGSDLVLLASHFPLLSRAAELAAVGLPYSGDLIDRSEVLEALASRAAPTVVLSGHLHIRDACSYGQVLQLFFAALIEHPFECSIVELAYSHGKLCLNRHAIPFQEGHATRHPIFVAAVEEWDFDGTNWISHSLKSKEAAK